MSETVRHNTARIGGKVLFENDHGEVFQDRYGTIWANPNDPECGSFRVKSYDNGLALNRYYMETVVPVLNGLDQFCIKD